MPTTDADSYEGSLQREAERGAKTLALKVPGNRPDEIAVIPRHLPFGNYRGKAGAKDVADEEKLAGFDFYKTGPAESGVIATLPKRTSTSAAVDIFEIPAATTRPAELTASYCSGVEKSGKCVAKFKQTDNQFTTTSTASILGYYHVSRALGDICEIKTSVLRTMDIAQHKKIVRLASEMGVRGTIAKSWKLFDKYYADPKSSSVASSLFTSDFTQIYGALLENTTGEENYADWLNAGANLSSTRAFKNMSDSRPAAAVVGAKAFSQGNVQTLVAMRDMSEMILLDYLLAQSDRLTGGNISDYRFIYYLDGGKVKSTKASKAKDIPAGAAQVTVKKLTLKDTDAGQLNSNVFEKKGYLTKIRHLHPETYDSLQKLAKKWSADSTVKEFFHRECTFSNSQLARFEKYLLNAAATLRSLKESGALHLDLDLDDFFQGTPPDQTGPVIAASVGRWEKGAENQKADVETVQRLLTTAAEASHLPQLDPKGVDGLISRPPRKSNTVAAIEAFEGSSQLTVSGVIAPGSPVWLALLKAAGEAPA